MKLVCGYPRRKRTAFIKSPFSGGAYSVGALIHGRALIQVNLYSKTFLQQRKYNTNINNAKGISILTNLRKIVLGRD